MLNLDEHAFVDYEKGEKSLDQYYHRKGWVIPDSLCIIQKKFVQKIMPKVPYVQDSKLQYKKFKTSWTYSSNVDYTHLQQIF